MEFRKSYDKYSIDCKLKYPNVIRGNKYMATFNNLIENK